MVWFIRRFGLAILIIGGLLASPDAPAAASSAEGAWFVELGIAENSSSLESADYEDFGFDSTSLSLSHRFGRR